ncbi:MAG: class D sortase [Patescibacteria group bacterium]
MPIKPITFEEKDLKKLFRLDTPVARVWRQTQRALKGLIWFMAIFAVCFLALNGPAFWQRTRFVTQGVSSPPIAVPPAPAPVMLASEIIISKIGVQAPVFYDTKFADIITQLRNGVVRYEGTADPGQIGNVVIVGHSSDFPWSTGSYKTIFALLDKLTLGDEIILPHGINRYIYKVTSTKVVRPTDLSVLDRTSTPTLTLITCYPVGTTLKRLVIQATLSEGPIGSVQATEPYLGGQIVPTR